MSGGRIHVQEEQAGTGRPGGHHAMVRVLAVLAVLFAAAGLWAAGTSPGQQSGDVHSVAATLRCPTCVAESAADSTAPLAVSMRETVAEQLADGRTPEQIRTWFAQRYGDEVLLDPPRRGAGWPLWLLPFAVAPVAVWIILSRHQHRRRLAVLSTAAVFIASVLIWAVADGETPATPPDEAEHTDVRVPLLERAAEDAPGDVQVRIALARELDEQGRVVEASEHYAAALRLSPQDDALRYRTAFALVRAGQPGEAISALDILLERNPDHPEALLLRATIAAEEQDPQAERLLRRFIEVAPEHPAVEQAEALLNPP